MVSTLDKIYNYISTKCTDIPKRTAIAHTVCITLLILVIIFIVLFFVYKNGVFVIITIPFILIVCSFLLWNSSVLGDYNTCLQIYTKS